MPTISLDAVEAATRVALTRHGTPEPIAHSVATAVREAEATGNLICGLSYVESYCQQIGSGRLKPDADPVLTRPKPGAVLVDAGLGFAQPAFDLGLPQAVSAAQENGIATLAIRRSHTCTSLGYFTRQIARAGLIGIGFTNASAIVAPPGGAKRVLGTNPLAMSVPDGQGGLYMHLDQATSAVALGTVAKAAAKGEPIPEGWAVDEQGNPTTDAATGLQGALMSAGGYRGWGFGLIVETLAAAVTGSALSVDTVGLKKPDGAPHELGQFYILLDAQVFAGDLFGQRMDRLSEVVTDQPGCRIPGAAKTMADPVTVDDKLWQTVCALGESGG